MNLNADVMIVADNSINRMRVGLVGARDAHHAT